MEGKAAQSVNDQEPWRSLQRIHDAIKVTDGMATAVASWRRSKSPSINSDWNGHEHLKKVSLSVKLRQQAALGETERPALCFQSFPSDWAWTMIFLKLSFLFSWSRPANCQIHCFIEENWKHDVLNSRDVWLAGTGTPKYREWIGPISLAQVCLT